jgi:phosphoesterase RecJ-like protein
VQYIVAVDVADEKLLGSLSNVGEIQLCIDHHGSNHDYAKNTCLNSDCASTTELLYEILCEMNVQITPTIADCLYTGLCTDTGCFKYTNTTAKTHRVAADLIEKNAKTGMINTLMFETKSPARVMVEKEVYNTMSMHYNGKCAVVAVTQNMLKTTGATEDELEGVAAMPRQIMGVQIGATIREKEDGSHKISVRTSEDADASLICSAFGGGGHKRAAGCTINAPLEKVKEMLLQEIKKHLK